MPIKFELAIDAQTPRNGRNPASTARLDDSSAFLVGGRRQPNPGVAATPFAGRIPTVVYSKAWNSDSRSCDIGEVWVVRSVSNEWRLRTLCRRVVCLEPTWNPFIPRGHPESLSVNSHIFAAIAFLMYTLVRAATLDLRKTPDALLVLAATSCVITFTASAYYHLVVPDDTLSRWGRTVDFLAIYLGLAMSYVADLGIITRGFSNIPLVTIIDVPVSVACISCFFTFRRWLLNEEDTLIKYCWPMGLWQHWHSDKDHQHVRQATTFAVSSFVFVLTPVLFHTTPSATIVLILLCVAFVLAVIGFMNDSIFQWPDRWMESKEDLLSWVRCGVFVNAHGIWHLIAILSAACHLLAREVALDGT